MIHDTHEQQGGKNEAVYHWLALVTLNPPDEMKNTKCRRDVGEAMKQLPPRKT
jgi:hypothetical protein